MADEIANSFLSSMKAKGRKAMDWFKSIARKAQRAAMPGRTGRREIMDDRNTGITSSIRIGRMYLFQYDAKWAEKLPYWDGSLHQRMEEVTSAEPMCRTHCAT